MAGNKVRSIESRLELFVDDYMIDSLTGTRLQLHHPRPENIALAYDAPWEELFIGMNTVIHDGGDYHMYYSYDGDMAKVTCYAHSTDGINWEKPELGLFEVMGDKQNNVILLHSPDAVVNKPCHNLSPFLDTRPGVPPEEKFKAVAGICPDGLFVLVSADGIHWRFLKKEPVLVPERWALDSQNVAFWSQSEQRYVLYFRTWKHVLGVGGLGYRWISRMTSRDFLHWDTPVEMESGDAAPEQLYTNQTQPYFRAPHIYIGLPMRFWPNKKVVSDDEANALQVHEVYRDDCSDVAFITSRGGNRYDRKFMESFIRPGPGLEHWVSRSNDAALGIVPTSPNEISLYVNRKYAQPDACLQRYSLRTDGFVSVNAPYHGGEFVTHEFTFTGRRLVVNYSTSAAGAIRMELQNSEGYAYDGFFLDDCHMLVGDEIAREVTWKKNANIEQFAGKPVRLRFFMHDADLYSFQFLP